MHSDNRAKKKNAQNKKQVLLLILCVFVFGICSAEMYFRMDTKNDLDSPKAGDKSRRFMVPPQFLFS